MQSIHQVPCYHEQYLKNLEIDKVTYIFFFPTACTWNHKYLSIIDTSSFARCTCSATSPSFGYTSNPAPDSYLSVQSCCSPFASASAVAPRLHPLQLLLPDFVLFSCSSRLHLLQLLLPHCIRFSCCSPIASASAAAPRLRPLQLLLPDCVRFSCSSPIASASVAQPSFANAQHTRAYTKYEDQYI